MTLPELKEKAIEVKELLKHIFHTGIMDYDNKGVFFSCSCGEKTYVNQLQEKKD